MSLFSIKEIIKKIDTGLFKSLVKRIFKRSGCFRSDLETQYLFKRVGASEGKVQKTKGSE